MTEEAAADPHDPARRDSGRATGIPRPEVLCLGEGMVLFTGVGGELADPGTRLEVSIAGAEANVAAGLAHLGHDVEWYSKVGEDPFGAQILTFLRSRRVLIDGVVRDPERPTGVFFKSRSDGRTDVFYYRLRSAAAGMEPSDVETLGLGGRRLLHVSGITAALSPSCDALMDLLVRRGDLSHPPDQAPARPSGGPTVSLDVNYRRGLWSVDEAAPRLLELAGAADIVFVGRDEAETLWGTRTAEDVRELLPQVPELVIKDADVGATYISSEACVFVPSLAVDVVDPVGAGDAFAAGFLSAWLREADVTEGMRLGHALAAVVLQDHSDLPPLPPLQQIRNFISVGADRWSTADAAKLVRHGDEGALR